MPYSFSLVGALKVFFKQNEGVASHWADSQSYFRGCIWGGQCQQVLHFLDVVRQMFCPLINHNHYLNLSFI